MLLLLEFPDGKNTAPHNILAASIGSETWDEFPNLARNCSTIVIASLGLAMCRFGGINNNFGDGVGVVVVVVVVDDVA